MRTNRSAFVVVLALALVAGACSGGNSPSPTAPSDPTPAEPKWSMNYRLNFSPAIVPASAFTSVDVVYTVNETGTVKEVTFIISRPDGGTDTKTVTGTSTTIGTEGMGFGYWPPLPGSYTVTATVKETKADKSAAPVSVGPSTFTRQ